MSSLHAVIMAGGSGTRFWPASRRDRPKQLLPIAGGVPMIEATVARVLPLCGRDNVWIVTNRAQKKHIARLLLDFPVERILVEPEPRDTAPCIAFATATIAAVDPDATLVVLPADHVIEPHDEFERMLRRGTALCDERTLVTFGVPPTFPATGYGYLELGDPIDAAAPAAAAVRSFREKPDEATARGFLAAGTFRWNSGILAFRAAAMRAAMAEHAPELAEATDRMLEALRGGNAGSVTRAFKRAPKISIDYAVMEKAAHLVAVDCTARWDDVGSFPALARVLPADRHGNHLSLHADAEAIALDAADNVVYGEGKRTIALFGVQGLVVCAVGDAVLVCPKDRADDLKRLVQELTDRGRQDLL
ncbi:MAG: NTP transferase domain-containing protein [Planctomycetes bacterium]|nr:NTP transferase domain-containing protein [Planctomycetota bacterium]